MKPPPVLTPVFKPGVFRNRKPRRARPRLKGLSFNHLLPNILTVLALCAGLTAIRFSMHERWQPAVVAIVIAAVLDALDGRIARLLNAQSKFGAELDSLADVVSFGVAPALIVYQWALSGVGNLGWIAALAYAVCCALRLARFNARLGAAVPPWAYNYFTGVPAPAGAGLVLMPMVIGFEIGPEIAGHPLVVVPWTLLVGGLMVSGVPTFSFKGVRVPQEYVVPALVGVGLIAASAVGQPWWTLFGLGLAYLISLPSSFRQYRKLARAAQLLQEPEGLESANPTEDEAGAASGAGGAGRGRGRGSE